MNKLTIIGNLTRDPELRTTTTGKSVCSFTVAVNRRRKVEGQPEADFFKVSAWNERADVCSKYLTKGRKVCVIGPVSVRTYNAQDGTTRAEMEVQADEVEFLSSKDENAQNKPPEAPKKNVPKGYTQVEMDTEELPF